MASMIESQRNSKQFEEVAMASMKTLKQIEQLIGYNQNQDTHLEFQIGQAFRSYLINNLKIPQDCIFEYTTTDGKISNPISGARYSC